MISKEEKEFDVRLGKKITSIRKIRGLSQVDCADLFDITFQQWQKYERGTNRISTYKLMKFAAHCRVGIDVFLEDSPYESISDLNGHDLHFYRKYNTLNEDCRKVIHNAINRLAEC